MPDVVAPLAIHAGMKTQLSAAALMGESTPLSVELIRDLYGDATAFHKAWDDSVDGLVEFGLVLPEAIEPLKLRGRAMHEAAI